MTVKQNIRATTISQRPTETRELHPSKLLRQPGRPQQDTHGWGIWLVNTGDPDEKNRWKQNQTRKTKKAQEDTKTKSNLNKNRIMAKSTGQLQFQVHSQRGYLPGNVRAFHASCCRQALWEGKSFYFPSGFGTCPQIQSRFESREITVVDGPANSPDLNPFENGRGGEWGKRNPKR